MNTHLLVFFMKDISERQLEIIEAASKLLANLGVSGLTIKNLAKKNEFF